MDSQTILLVDLGQLPGLTRRLLGGLMVTFIEQAMRRRSNRTLWTARDRRDSPSSSPMMRRPRALPTSCSEARKYSP